ncbi:hypothetical protein E2C01_030340 [Portunus trituberculatus]|uniref:Uncharacterized protein n=1 Tax=Portunus trituberculatus TaxID=210409 RepID=A0A5B7EQL2_PORTR|nr:hypothetical protein [Portunus trituberculatus]
MPGHDPHCRTHSLTALLHTH